MVGCRTQSEPHVVFKTMVDSPSLASTKLIHDEMVFLIYSGINLLPQYRLFFSFLVLTLLNSSRRLVRLSSF